MKLHEAIARLDKYESSKRISDFHKETMELATHINRTPDSLAFEELASGLTTFIYDFIVDLKPQKAATAAIKLRMFLFMAQRDKHLDYWSMYRWSDEAKNTLVEALLTDQAAS